MIPLVYLLNKDFSENSNICDHSFVALKEILEFRPFTKAVGHKSFSTLLISYFSKI